MFIHRLNLTHQLKYTHDFSQPDQTITHEIRTRAPQAGTISGLWGD